MIKTKVKIKGYLDNITDNNHITIDTIGIQDKNKITYMEDDIKNTLIIKDSHITLFRENKDFQNQLDFDTNKPTDSPYYLKEAGITIDLTIQTDNIAQTENNIVINYTVLESTCVYEYNIEMRNAYEYKR